MRTCSLAPSRWSDDRERWVLPLVLEARAGTHGDKTFLIEGDGLERRYTYRDCYEFACAVGNGFLARGLAPGDRVVLSMDNRAEIIFGWFGASLAGLIEVPLNPQLSGEALEHIVGLTAPRSVVTTASTIGNYLASRPSLPEDLTFYIVGADEEVSEAERLLLGSGWKCEAFTNLLAGPATPLQPNSTVGTTVAVLPTSGTTGPAKGVIMPFGQMHLFAETVVTYCDLTDADVIEAWLPLFHSGGQAISTYAPLLVGGSLVIFKSFDPVHFLDRVRRFGVTTTFLAGQLMDLLWQQPACPDDADSSLRCVSSTPVAEAIAEAFAARFGIAPVVTAYAQSETAYPFLTPFGDTERPIGASGLLSADVCDVMLIDRSGAEVEVGVVGELLIRMKHPSLASEGYWGMPEATAKAKRDGWFQSGDAFRRDTEGWFYFVDRVSDKLVLGGEDVSSLALEQVLQQHDRVLECAIVGVEGEGEGDGTEIMAIVRLSEPTPFEDLVAWALSSLPDRVVPRYWRAVDELPKSPTGKVQKFVLRSAGRSGSVFDRTRTHGE